MTQMNVAMTLTLADTASAGVRAFTGLLESLQGVTTTLNGRLEQLAAAFSGLAGRASAASAEMSAVGTGATAAATGTASLETAVSGLSTSLAGLTGRLEAAVAGMAGLSTEARAAGGATAASSAQMEAGMIAANSQAGTLMTTIKGMAQIWAGLKIGKFYKESVGDAGDFQVIETQLQGLNLGAEKTQEIPGKAWDDSKALKFASVLDTIQGRMAAIAGLASPMDQHVIDATLPRAMTLANNISLMGGKGDQRDMLRNLYGLVEARGQTEDPEAIKRTFDLVQRSYLMTGGKINLADIEKLVRQFGQGASQLSDDGLMRMIAVSEQLKISGGEGGGGGGAQRAGTAYKMLQAYGMGKNMSKQGLGMLIEAGIVDPGMVVDSGDSVLSKNVKPGAWKDSSLLTKDPVQWVEKQMPAIIAFTQKYAKQYYDGKDVKDPEAIAMAVQKFFTGIGVSVTAAQAFGIAGQATTQARVENTMDIGRNAKGVEDLKKDFDDTLPQKIKQAEAAFTNLKVIIGTQLLPVLTPLIEKFAEFLQGLSQFSKDHPAISFLSSVAVSFLGLAAVVKGLDKIFGGAISGMLGWLFKLGGSATASAGAFTSMGAIIRTGLAVLGRLFARAIPWVGLALLAADVIAFIGDLEVGGHKIADWAVRLANQVGDAFQNMWIRTKQFFGFLTKDAADAMVRANNLAADKRDAAKGFNTATVKDWGSGSSDAKGWDPALPFPSHEAHKSRADLIREKQLADAQQAQGGPHVETGPRGRFAHYDKALDDAKNADRLLEDEQRRHQAAEDQLYKAGEISIATYYGDKLKTLTDSILKEIEQLEKEKAAYLKQGDKAGANRAQSDITIKMRDLMGAPDVIALERKQALLKLDKDMADFQREELKASGERHQAELVRIQAEIDAKSKQLLIEGRITQAQVDAAKARAVAASNYGYGHEEIAQLQDEERRKEDAITAAVSNGTKTQSQAEREIYDLRKQMAAQLDGLLDRLRVLAEASGDKKLVQQINDLASKNKIAMEELPPTVRQFNQEMSRTISGGFGNIFYGIAHGAKAADKAIADLGANLKDTFLRIISQRLGEKLFDSLFGNMFGGKSGDGGVFGLVFNALGLFSGGGTQAPAPVVEGSFKPVGGSYASGIDYIPRDMLAEIHKGEL